MEDKKLTEKKLKKFEELVERLEMVSKEKPHPKHPHPPAPHHHEERRELKIDFKADEDLLKEIFGDDDTARAVTEIMTTSPTEIQIVLKVVIDLYRKVNESKGE